MEEAWYAGCFSVAIPIMGPNTLGYGFETAAAVGIRAVEDWFYAALSWNKLNQFRTVMFFLEDEPNSTTVLGENAAIRAFE
jgi:O-acetyl-ADP-ribose deacetylase (regulator of RNase III)